MTCRSCQAPIYWAVTPSGGKAPIDCDVTPKGNVLLLEPAGFGLLAVVLSKDALAHAQEHGCQLRTNHWATCPDREKWRERTDQKRAESSAA